jgi:hypothetical protein
VIAAVAFGWLIGLLVVVLLVVAIVVVASRGRRP